MVQTILIIEDDRRIANWIKVYFERAGFATETAFDGETGLAMARERISRFDYPGSEAAATRWHCSLQ